MVQVCWTLENGGTTMSERFRALGFDPARMEDVFRYVNTPYPGSGPQLGKHHLGIDFYLGEDMEVSDKWLIRLFEPQIRNGSSSSSSSSSSCF